MMRQDRVMDDQAVASPGRPAPPDRRHCGPAALSDAAGSVSNVRWVVLAVAAAAGGIRRMKTHTGLTAFISAKNPSVMVGWMNTA